MRALLLARLVAVLGLLTLVGPVPAEAAPGDFGQFSTKCTFTHANNDDPIAYPGEAGRAHRHHYFGNGSVDYLTTTGSLESGTSNCDRLQDRSAYWVPALYNDGVELPFSAAHVYYRNGNVIDKTGIVPLPRGLRMIAGTAAHPEPPTRSRTAQWACVGGDGAVSDDFPDTCASGKVFATITFPSCWDGIRLKSDDQSHMAYPWQNDANPRACAGTHPVALPEITEWFRWNVGTADMSGLTLASGTGDSLHADFWNAWNVGVQAGLVDKCLVGGVHCGTVGH